MKKISFRIAYEKFTLQKQEKQVKYNIKAHHIGQYQVKYLCVIS